MKEAIVDMMLESPITKKMKPSKTIQDLPDPIIEYVLSYLSPYRDLKQCMLVNKAWYRYVYGKFIEITL